MTVDVQEFLHIEGAEILAPWKPRRIAQVGQHDFLSSSPGREDSPTSPLKSDHPSLDYPKPVRPPQECHS
jgi:hypothetical protein